MSPDAREALAGMAARAGVRTRAANMSYRGIRDNFERRGTFKSDGIRIDVYAGPALLYIQLHRESCVLFATPRREPILNVGLLLGQVAGRDVYVNEQGLGSPTPWIYSSGAVTALRAIELGDDELLTVNLGGLTALLNSRGADVDSERLQQLIDLARILPSKAGEEPLDPERLPEDLRPLVPLLAKWGKTDDAERADLIEGAETGALEELVQRGRPLLRRIAEFLGQPEVRDSEYAAELDALAQAVMEADQELRHRTG